MKQGKLPESVLTRSVFKLLQQNNEEILYGPALGEDCGIVKISESGACACSMDPVIGSIKDVGFRAVHTAVNNLAASGIETTAMMISILLPIEVKEKELKQLMRDIQAECSARKISILGGHTENSAAVNRPVVTITAIGEVKEDYYMTKFAKADQDIVMTKYAALEGTALIARAKSGELQSRYSKDFIGNAKEFLKDLSIVKEAEFAKKFGISAMHDIHKGGVYAALWELTSAAQIGMKITIEDVPIKQETIEICEYYDLNPYKLLSGGSLLIVAERGHELAGALKMQGISASVIGKTTQEQSRIIVREGEVGFLESPKSDDIYQVL